jgi:hypothetical protein
MRYFDEHEYWGDKAEKIIDQDRLTARSVKMFADGKLIHIILCLLFHENLIFQCQVHSGLVMLP